MRRCGKSLRSLAFLLPVLLLVSGNQVLGSPQGKDLVNHCGTVLGAVEIVPYYYGPWNADEIAAHEQYLNGLARYLSGENAPDESQPVLAQYGVDSASVAPAVTNLTAALPTPLDANAILSLIRDGQASGAVPPYANNRLILLLLPHNAVLTAPCSAHGAEGGGRYFAYLAQDCAPWPQSSARAVFQAVVDPGGPGRPSWDDPVEPCGDPLPLWFGVVPSVWDNTTHSCSTTGYDRTQRWGTALAAAPRADLGSQVWAVDPWGTIWSASKGPSLDAEWSAWSRVAGAPNAIHVAAAALPDGRIRLWAIESQGLALWSTVQTAADVNAAWEEWKQFPISRFPLANVAVATLPDGRLQMWGVDLENRLWTAWMVTRASDSKWAPWNLLPGVPKVRQLAVAPTTDGRLQIWAVDIQNVLWTSWMTNKMPDAAWNVWRKMPNAPAVKQIAAGLLTDKRIQLFATDMQDRLLTSWKVTTVPNANWTGWSVFPDNSQVRQAQWVATGSLVDGRPEVWYADMHSRLFTTCKCNAEPHAYWTGVSQFITRANP